MHVFVQQVTLQRVKRLIEDLVRSGSGSQSLTGTYTGTHMLQQKKQQQVHFYELRELCEVKGHQSEGLLMIQSGEVAGSLMVRPLQRPLHKGGPHRV